MFTSMKLRDRMPQIELAVGEDVTVFVLRHLEPMPEEDAGEAARLRRSPRHPVVAAAQGAGDRASVLPAGRAGARLPPARVRPARSRYRPDRVHAGERGREPRAGEARRGPARPAAGRARGRPLLRPRQLHAGARHARRATWSAWRARPRWSQRAQENARAQRARRRARSFVAHDLYKDAEGALARLGPVDKLLIDPPRDGALEICKALPEPGAFAHRLRLLQPRHARARRGRARAT